MREHPIPQDITGYRFHIIGNMTLKQFAQLGAGCFVGFLFYATNLIDILKWPLITLSVGLGAMVAFVPFEERPLDHWLITFIKILYKPTKFYWKREAKIPDPFLYTSRTTRIDYEEEFDFTPARRERIREYLASVNRPQGSFSQDLSNQSDRISNIMSTFNEMPVSRESIEMSSSKPNLKVSVRGLSHSAQTDLNTFEWQGAYHTHDHTTVENQSQHPLQQSQQTPIEYRTPLKTEQVAQDISVPEKITINIGQNQNQEDPQTTALSYNQNANQQAYVDNSTIATTSQPITTTNDVTFNSQLPFPSPPTEPNKIVGMALTQQNDLVNDAIVEIKDTAGKTIRAVKTNALGQFFISTPLPNGDFVILTEKEGLEFPPISLKSNNTVINPVEIRSTT